MAEQVSLDAQGLDSALAVLQREQAACLPTERERKLYRWFNLCVYSMAVVFVLLFAMAGMVNDENEDAPLFIVFGLLGVIAGLLMIGTVVLFFLNGKLMRKLYRHAQLRKRLKLGEYFASAFSAELRTSAMGNIVTLLTTIAGWLLIVFSFFGAVAVVIADVEARKTGLGILSTVYLVTFLVGASFVSFRYMRRGKQQLEVVLRLQKTLTAQAAPGAEAKQVKLSADDYNAIAALEREHIIRDRATSIASARKQADAPGYLCQSSRQMHLAKSRLSPELLVKVEGAIAELLVDPRRPAGEPGGQKSTLPVAGTGLRIEYDVDAKRHLVRLYDLQTERGASVGEGGTRADGLS